MTAPVDFSDLSSEYIGILYEGLLDFELHRVPEDDAVVFLRVGDEPALPLSRLEQMAPKSLADLLGKLNKSTKRLATSETEVEEEEHDETEEVEAAEEAEEVEEVAGEVEPAADEDHANDESSSLGEEASDDDIDRVVRERAEVWAEKAVKEAKLVPIPRSDVDSAVRERWDEEVKKKAKSLYRLVLPGRWYLVRWGGTRKGAGTFYTRPQLSVPTVRRALQPLCYEASEQVIDKATGLTNVTKWAPRQPEKILAIKICDPAMGSGSFLVGALRYLIDALVESLYFHGRFHARPDGAICKLADGLPLDDPSQETMPLPLEHPEFDERLRARLKRHVVERCIYGVDIDPLAVELARMALWIETMDRRLPFEFLDHKLRCGNSLVGCWFDRFQDYPVMAFERDDAGDKSHDRFVHHFREYTAQRGKKKGAIQRSGDVWTYRWKQVREDVIKPELRAQITAGRKDVFPFMRDGYSAVRIHDDALAVFRELHDLPVHEADRREQLYREKIADNPTFTRLREAFDTWCAIWFWPGDKLDIVPSPKSFSDPTEETRELVARLREEHLFFHWELEFPDVFTGSGSGFSALVGNPPWETLQPNSKEFFSNIDPLYRTYGKQEALRLQKEYFDRSAITEHDWLSYCARFKSLSIWNKYAAFPFGDREDDEGFFAFTRSRFENETLHEAWRQQRTSPSGYADPNHPFRHQGEGKPYSYKMFLEASFRLIEGTGRLGLILPSGIYSDRGSKPLRQLLLDRAQWEWLFGFWNRRLVFPIDSTYRFAVIVAAKGERTTAIRTAFFREELAEWGEDTPRHLAVNSDFIKEVSPRSLAVITVDHALDVTVLRRLYENSALLGDGGPEGWGIKYRQGDFNMTTDSSLFPPRPWWEGRGYQRDEYGLWIGPDREVASPLYEGRMIGQFDFSKKGWVRGKGRGAEWRDIPWQGKVLEPQFLLALAYAPPEWESLRIAFMAVTRATVKRTMIAAPVVRATLWRYSSRGRVRGACACWPPSILLCTTSSPRSVAAVLT